MQAFWPAIIAAGTNAALDEPMSSREGSAGTGKYSEPSYMLFFFQALPNALTVVFDGLPVWHFVHGNFVCLEYSGFAVPSREANVIMVAKTAISKKDSMMNATPPKPAGVLILFGLDIRSDFPLVLFWLVVSCTLGDPAPERPYFAVRKLLPVVGHLDFLTRAVFDYRHKVAFERPARCHH